MYSRQVSDCEAPLHTIKQLLAIDKPPSPDVLQSKSFNSVGRNISALVGCIKKLRAHYEVQLLETYKIPQFNLI